MAKSAMANVKKTALNDLEESGFLREDKIIDFKVHLVPWLLEQTQSEL